MSLLRLGQVCIAMPLFINPKERRIYLSPVTKTVRLVLPSKYVYLISP